MERYSHDILKPFNLVTILCHVFLEQLYLRIDWNYLLVYDVIDVLDIAIMDPVLDLCRSSFHSRFQLFNFVVNSWLNRCTSFLASVNHHSIVVFSS